MKTLEEVIEMVWIRYIGHMTTGRMRQRPGRSEYQIELVNAGLMPKTEQAARDFYFAFRTKSDLGRRILKVEKKMVRRLKAAVAPKPVLYRSAPGRTILP